MAHRPTSILRESPKACAARSTATVAGQAQKEVFVNEAHARADMLLHPAIAGEASAPPTTPQDGVCWLVGPAATGAWAGREGQLAGRQAGNWLFAAPRDGLTVFDLSVGKIRRYANGWHAANAVAAPAGGTVIDTQARSAITGLIAALVAGGILPSA
jgi:Protein of unknown function (DUF2793)